MYCFTKKALYGINIKVIFWVRQMIACIFGMYEESPGSTGHGCRITSGVGNYRESATETHRRNGSCRGKVEIVR